MGRAPSRKPRELIQSGSFRQGGEDDSPRCCFRTSDPAASAGASDPAALAECSASALAKKNERVTADGFPVHSFEPLLGELAIRRRNTCRIAAQPATACFTQLTASTPLQSRAFRLRGL